MARKLVSSNTISLDVFFFLSGEVTSADIFKIVSKKFEIEKYLTLYTIFFRYGTFWGIIISKRIFFFFKKKTVPKFCQHHLDCVGRSDFCQRGFILMSTEVLPTSFFYAFASMCWKDLFKRDFGFFQCVFSVGKTSTSYSDLKSFKQIKNLLLIYVHIVLQ